MIYRKIYFREMYRHLKKTNRQLQEIVKIMKRRHPYEDWCDKRKEIDGRVVKIYSLEFLEWIQDVYLCDQGNYLDREICFYEKRIIELENELGISIPIFQDLLLKDLPRYFKKHRSGVTRSIQRMRKLNGKDFEYKNCDGFIVINTSGVEWLAKNHFKKFYLKEIEKYKRSLQDALAKKGELNNDKKE